VCRRIRGHRAGARRPASRRLGAIACGPVEGGRRGLASGAVSRRLFRVGLVVLLGAAVQALLRFMRQQQSTPEPAPHRPGSSAESEPARPPVATASGAPKAPATTAATTKAPAAKATTAKATTARATPAKAPTKKAAADKAPPKKASAKKTAARKATPSASAKKAAAKKAGTKKASAKKAPPSGGPDSDGDSGGTG
jgi:cytoskeletal protein RodZ